MSAQAEVVCVGGAVVDIPLHPVGKHVFDAESYPLERIAMTVGGDAMNESTVIRRLGHTTALMSLLGDDPAGRFVLDFCHKNGIDTRDVVVDPGVDTSINIGLVTPDGERTFITSRSGSLWKLSAAHVRADHFAGARLLSLASLFNSPLLDNAALTSLFRAAGSHGLIVCADMIKPRLGESLADIREALSYVDYFFPNYAEACLLTRETELERVADVLLACGVKHVVIKNGRKGCYLKDRAGAMEIPAFGPMQAVDTIGAGDNFVSGFISGILEGMSPRDCARLANAAAAISVTAHGATEGVRDRRQVDELMKSDRRIPQERNVDEP